MLGFRNASDGNCVGSQIPGNVGSDRPAGLLKNGICIEVLF